MKKVIIIIVLAVFSVSAYATGFETDYVVTDKGVEYFYNVNYGANSYLTAKLTDGEKMKFSKDEILEYRKDGKVYTKKHIDSMSKTAEFMNLMKTKNGFSLYMLEEYSVNGDLIQSFYVFKGDAYVLEVNKENALQVLAFFNR